jgi:pyrroloquinoline quinone biosynthesis protein B
MRNQQVEKERKIVIKGKINKKIGWQLALFAMLFAGYQYSMASAADPIKRAQASKAEQTDLKVELVVLGIAQDAGYPQLNCYRPHCMAGWQDPSVQKLATSIAVVDHINRQKFVFEATPDIKTQFYRLHTIAPDDQYSLAGILLTHAHMGHYAGLMHLGREAAGTSGVPVYVMPRMAQYLSNNGPWSQLVELNNIRLKTLRAQRWFALNSHLKVERLLVPHRDEYSETVAFRINGPTKKVLFVPDIDKWQKWSMNIVELIQQVDYALVDATFFSGDELPNRDLNEIPHPLVEESMNLFASLTASEKQKVIFIHFNHSNPLLAADSEARRKVIARGFRIAEEGMRLEM